MDFKKLYLIGARVFFAVVCLMLVWMFIDINKRSSRNHQTTLTDTIPSFPVSEVDNDNKIVSSTPLTVKEMVDSLFDNSFVYPIGPTREEHKNSKVTNLFFTATASIFSAQIYICGKKDYSFQMGGLSRDTAVILPNGNYRIALIIKAYSLESKVVRKKMNGVMIPYVYPPIQAKKQAVCVWSGYLSGGNKYFELDNPFYRQFKKQSDVNEVLEREKRLKSFKEALEKKEVLK